MRITEVTNLILPRPLVESAIALLSSLGPSKDPLAKLLEMLERSLNRDHHREAARRIQAKIGQLGDGELLDEIAAKLERPDPAMVIEQLRQLVREANEETLDQISNDLGEGRFVGVDVETHRRTVLRRLGEG